MVVIFKANPSGRGYSIISRQRTANHGRVLAGVQTCRLAKNLFPLVSESITKAKALIIDKKNEECDCIGAHMTKAD